MAGKARGALQTVRKAARHLWASDRKEMTQALAVSYIKSRQEIWSEAPAYSLAKLARAYNACARVAAGVDCTNQALEQLKWPSFETQLRAAQTKLAEKVVKHQQPSALYSLLERVPSPEEGAILTRRRKVQEWEYAEPSHKVGLQSFAYWAPMRLHVKAIAEDRKQSAIAEKKETAASRRQNNTKRKQAPETAK